MSHILFLQFLENIHHLCEKIVDLLSIEGLVSFSSLHDVLVEIHFVFVHEEEEGGVFFLVGLGF